MTLRKQVLKDTGRKSSDHKKPRRGVKRRKMQIFYSDELKRFLVL